MKAKNPQTIDHLVLFAERAEDLMTRNPISIEQRSPLHDAEAMLTDREISAAPVIDEAGRPVGVISRADIVRHDRERSRSLAALPEFYDKAELNLATGESLGTGFQVETIVPTEVREVMTPTVISVPPEMPAWEVVARMVALKIHRLFVVDKGGVLVGVISALDILRNLRREPRAT
jgi:CBS domain-containing protein